MADNKPYDSTDPKQVKKAKRDARILQERMRNGILKMVADRDIRYVLAQYLDTAGVFRSVFHPTPTQHAFNEGQRNSGLWWVQQGLLHAPNFLDTLQNDDDSPLKAGADDYTSSSTGGDASDGDPGNE